MSCLSSICCGNTPGVEWFCQQGVDPHQVEVDGGGALSLAIGCSRPQGADGCSTMAFGQKEMLNSPVAGARSRYWG